MKKLSLFLTLFLSLVLVSCAGVAPTGGLFFIPLGLLLASLYCLRITIIGWKSGSTVQVRPGVWESSDKRILPKGPAVYTVAFLIAAIATFFMIKSDYREQKPKDVKKWEKYKQKYGGVGDTSAYDTTNYR